MLGGGDSHIWLAPANAKAIGLYVGGVLAERYPEHAARFKANAERLAAEIDALTAELEKETAPLRERPFVVFHDAYQYFDDSFDLDAVGSITVSPNVQPSAKRLDRAAPKNSLPRCRVRVCRAVVPTAPCRGADGGDAGPLRHARPRGHQSDAGAAALLHADAQSRRRV